MDNKSIKENLIKLRKDLGISQTAMADKLNVSRNTYYLMENGPTKIFDDRLVDAAKVLDVPIEKMVLGYLPAKAPEAELKEIQIRYDKEKKELISDYEAKLKERDEANRMMMNTIESQKETIQSKNELIAMLRARIKKENE